MSPKIKLYQELAAIATSILKEIVSPICGISDIQADLWLCDISIYTMEDPVLGDKILEQIAETYGLTEDLMIYLDAYTPLMQIALFIYLQNRLEPADG